jgi:hypothetical protein
METETGYMIVLRCIESPQLQSLMKTGGLSLCGSFHWETFDAVHRDAQGECDEVQFTVAGSIGSDSPKYTRRCRDEILIALVRYETQYLDANSVYRVSHRRRKHAFTSDSVVDEVSSALLHVYVVI